MKKLILILSYLIGLTLPCLILSHYVPLSSSDYEDPEMNVGWLAGIGFIVSMSLWFLFAHTAKGRLRYFAVSPYYFLWTVVVYIAAGYYSFAEDETIEFSILLSRAAFVIFIVALFFFLFELFFPDKVRSISERMNKVMDN